MKKAGSMSLGQEGAILVTSLLGRLDGGVSGDATQEQLKRVAWWPNSQSAGPSPGVMGPEAVGS